MELSEREKLKKESQDIIDFIENKENKALARLKAAKRLLEIVDIFDQEKEDYLRSIINYINQGNDKESRTKIREIVIYAKARNNAKIAALAITAIQEVAVRVEVVARMKLAELE